MSAIQFDIEDGLAIIVLNRPEKFNAFNRDMALHLQKCLTECNMLEQVRAVYITGNGKAFSAGQDISELVGENAITLDRILSEHYNPIVSQIRELKKPIVAAVNGVAAGAGANIALCCDIVVASEQASFIQAFSKIGLIPDSGGTYFLPRLIGWQKASALMLTGDKVSAIEAEKMGMIYKVFTQDDFAAQSLDIAKKLAKMPTKALAATKKLLTNALTSNFTEQLFFEDVAQQKMAATQDYAEGIASFLEKREPVFKGK
jgi:2-(1,2-epoxy-1,2-dihydrophenyl)acetyl-CoA isomerase